LPGFVDESCVPPVVDLHLEQEAERDQSWRTWLISFIWVVYVIRRAGWPYVIKRARRTWSGVPWLRTWHHPKQKKPTKTKKKPPFLTPSRYRLAKNLVCPDQKWAHQAQPHRSQQSSNHNGSPASHFRPSRPKIGAESSVW
jgi:hypothetical protein